MAALTEPVFEDAALAWPKRAGRRVAHGPDLADGLLIVLVGVNARVGARTAGRAWLQPWRTIGGETLDHPHLPELPVPIRGAVAAHRYPYLARDFVVFADDGSGALAKKLPGYHRFGAVPMAVAATLCAAGASCRRDPSPKSWSRRSNDKGGAPWPSSGSSMS